MNGWVFFLFARFSFGSNTNEERKGEKKVNPVMQKATPEDFDRTLHRAERKLNFPKKYEPKPRNDPLRYQQTWLHAQRLHAPRCNNSVCTQGIDALREPSFNRFYAHFPHGICSFIYFPERFHLSLQCIQRQKKEADKTRALKKHLHSSVLIGWRFILAVWNHTSNASKRYAGLIRLEENRQRCSFEQFIVGWMGEYSSFSLQIITMNRMIFAHG